MGNQARGAVGATRKTGKSVKAGRVTKAAKAGRKVGAGSSAQRAPRRIGVDALAEMLHRGAIGLLRGVKVADAETGVSPPRLSALSVLVFGGPQSLKSLAIAEGVKPPSMSVLVADLEASGLVAKASDPEDARGVVISATNAGRKLMLEGRARRLAILEARLAGLTKDERRALAQAAPVLLKLAAGKRKDDP
jgi:DNA-binding MarR family transcriptional regulator